MRCAGSPLASPPKAASRTWYRAASEAKELRFTFGTGGSRGHLTVEQARDKAKSILGKMADGIDPREAKRADEAAHITLDEILNDNEPASPAR